MTKNEFATRGIGMNLSRWLYLILSLLVLGLSSSFGQDAALTAGEPKQETLQTLTITTLSDKNGSKINFNWGLTKTAVAVIKDHTTPMAAQYWIVFDHKANLDIPNFLEKPILGVQLIENISSKEAVVLRLVVDANLTPIPSLDGDQWVIQFNLHQPEVVKKASITLPKSKDETLLMSMENLGKEVRFVDPYTGYTNVVFPTYETGFGIDQEQSFPEFVIKQSVQGIGLVLCKDGLSLQANSKEIRLSHADGLAISLPKDRDEKRTMTTPIGFFADAQELDWVSRRQKINELLLDFPHDQHASGELEIAWLLLSYGHSADALGYLTHLSQERPSIVHVPLFQFLQGIGNILLNRLNLGEKNLWACREEPEASIWLSLSKVLQNPEHFSSNSVLLTELRSQFQLAQAMAKSYPKPLRIQLTTLMLMAGIALQDVDIINMILNEEARPENIGAAEVYDLARARILMKQAKTDAAFQILGELMERSSSPIVQAIARFDYVKHRFDAKMMSKDDVFSQLENLKSQWHGNWLAYQVGLYVNKMKFGKNS